MSEKGVGIIPSSSDLVRVPDSIVSSPTSMGKRDSLTSSSSSRRRKTGNAAGTCSSIAVLPDPAKSSAARRISLVEEEESCDYKVLGDKDNMSVVNINDVLCMRGPTAFHHVGNRRFRVRVELNLKAYFQREFKEKRSPNASDNDNDSAASDDADWRDHKRKGRIVDEVIKIISQSNPPGRFLVKSEDTGCLVQATPEIRRLKVEQTFSAAGRYLGLIESATSDDHLDTHDSQTQTPQTTSVSIHTSPPEVLHTKPPPKRKRKSVQFKPELAAAVSQPINTQETTMSHHTPSPHIISHKAFDSINDNDVICETDQKCFNTIGNRRFRVLVEAGLGTFVRAAAKEKREDQEAIQSYVVQRVIAAVQSSFHPFPGRFLQLKKHGDAGGNKESNWPWRIMTQQEAQEKTEEVFRLYADMTPHLRIMDKMRKRRKVAGNYQREESTCLWRLHDGWGNSYTEEEKEENNKEETTYQKEQELSASKVAGVTQERISVPNGDTTALDHSRKGVKRHHPGKTPNPPLSPYDKILCSKQGMFGNLVETTAAALKDAAKHYSDDDDDDDNDAIINDALADSKSVTNDTQSSKHNRGGRMVQTFRDPDDSTRFKAKLKEHKIHQSTRKCYGDALVAIAAAEDAKARANAVRDKTMRGSSSSSNDMPVSSPQSIAFEKVLKMAEEQQGDRPSTTKPDKFLGAKNKAKVAAHLLSSHDEVSSSQGKSPVVAAEELRGSKRVSLDLGECVKYAKLQEEGDPDDTLERKELPQHRVPSGMAAAILAGGTQLESLSEGALSHLQSHSRAVSQAQRFIQNLSSSKATSPPPKPEVVSSNTSSSPKALENVKEEETVEQLQERAKMLLLKRQWNNKASDRLMPALEAYQKATLCGVYGAATGATPEVAMLQQQDHKKAQNAAQMLSIGSTKKATKLPIHESGAGICLSGPFSSIKTKKESESNPSAATAKEQQPLENLSALQAQAKSLLKKRQYEPTPEPRFDSHPRRRLSNVADLVKSSSLTPETSTELTSEQQAPDNEASFVEQCPPPPTFNTEQTPPLPSSPPETIASPPLEPPEAWMARKRRSIALPQPQEVKLTKKATPARVLRSIEGQYDDADDDSENDTMEPPTEHAPRSFHGEIATQQPTGSSVLSNREGCPARRLSDAVGGILMMTTKGQSDVDITGFVGAATEEKVKKYLKASSEFHNESSVQHSMQQKVESVADPSQEAERAVIEAMLAVRYRGEN